MRKFVGITCILLGVVCLFASVGLMLYNRLEEQNAEEYASVLLKDVQQEIIANIQEMTQENVLDQDEQDTPPPRDPEQEGGQSGGEDAIIKEEIIPEMKTVRVGGYEYIGILSIPALNLELPVMTDWSYAKLKKAPCHYYGSCYETDFVIAAHNYKSHFGRLSKLQPTDQVVFTDVMGNAYRYEVMLLETLPKTATKEMITSGFDLSLYTCTTGGGSRVTVRCQYVGG